MKNRRRESKIITYIEPFLYEALSVNTRLQDPTQSLSDRLRQLIIDDLKRKEVLTDAMIAEHLV